MNIYERFWSKVDISGDCWLWTAYTRHDGYGTFMIDRVPEPAHRFAWECVNEKVPSGITLDHLCRTRNCVNPAHLEIVTRGENVLRGVGPTAQNARKTRCKNGHPLSGDNLILDDGSRKCRICTNARQRKRQARLRSGMTFTRNVRI